MKLSRYYHHGDDDDGWRYSVWVTFRIWCDLFLVLAMAVSWPVRALLRARKP